MAYNVSQCYQSLWPWREHWTIGKVMMLQRPLSQSAATALECNERLSCAVIFLCQQCFDIGKIALR